MNKFLLTIMLFLPSYYSYAESGFESEFESKARAGSVEMKQKQKSCRELASYRRIYGCQKKLFEESDALLNKEYNDLMFYLDGNNDDNLRNAQRQWIKFRDADCFFSDPRGGKDTIANANKAACLADRTIKRLEELERYNQPWNKGCNGCPW